MGGTKGIDGGSSRPQPKVEKTEKPQSAEKTQKAEKPQGAAVREARNKDSFEAAPARSKKVELNPSAPPANTNVEAPKNKDQDADRRARIDAELQKTETGRQAKQDLERSGAKVDFEAGDKSYFEPARNRVVIGRDQSPAEAASALVNESVHAAAYADGKAPDPSKMTRDQYSDAMVREEAQSSAREIEHRRELAAQGQPVGGGGTALDRRYGDAHDGAVAAGLSAEQARETGRAAVLQGMKDGDAVAGVTGQKYGDYYASQYDRVAAGEISAADVVRSNDAPAPLANPGKIGVVLNAPVGQLPEVGKLTENGVGRVRITLQAKYLEGAETGFPPNAPQDAGKMNTAALDALEKKLASYRAAGIEVTLNVPPEVVNGMPEHKRFDPEYDPANPTAEHPSREPVPQFHEGDNELHQGGVPDPASVSPHDWNAYETNYAKRAGELAERLGPWVDNWEVGNEPDATEKKYEIDPGQPSSWVTGSDGTSHPIRETFDPGLPPERYASLFKAASKAIRDADVRDAPADPAHPGWVQPPNQAKVLIAGLVAGDPEKSWTPGMKSYLQQVHEADPTIDPDGIAVHPYAKNDAESFKRVTDNYATLANQLWGKDLPIYVTEASPGGGKADDPRYQAQVKDYIDELAPATDQSSKIQGTYFFLNKTFDGHGGIDEMPPVRDELRRLLQRGIRTPPAP